MTTNLTGCVDSAVLRSFLTKNSPCFPMKGILNQILGLVSTEESPWDGISFKLCLLQSALELTSYLALSLRIIENHIGRKANPRHEFWNHSDLFVQESQVTTYITARWKSDLTHAVLRDQGSKLQNGCIDLCVLTSEKYQCRSRKFLNQKMNFAVFKIIYREF